MKWNPEKRRYEDSKGNPIPPAQVRAWLEDYISANKDEIEAESNKMLKAGASAVLISGLFSFLRERIQTMHGTAGVIAYGGEAEMNAERWARVADKIEREYKYLNGFEQAVNASRQTTDEIIHQVSLVSNVPVEQAILTTPPSQLVSAVEGIAGPDAAGVVVQTEPLFESLIWGEVGSRGRLYADSVYGTHENNVKSRKQDAGVLTGRRVCENDQSSCQGCIDAATDEYIPLEEILDIGSAECMSACRCDVIFNYHGVEPLQIDRGIYATGGL